MGKIQRRSELSKFFLLERAKSRKIGSMRLNICVNPTSEHELYLRLFITNGGGW